MRKLSVLGKERYKKLKPAKPFWWWIRLTPDLEKELLSVRSEKLYLLHRIRVVLTYHTRKKISDLPVEKSVTCVPYGDES